MTSFANRIFLIILALVVVVGVSAMYASLGALRQDTVQSSTEDLRVGQLVLAELLTARQQQLATTVSVLSKDFGFVEAVATHDELTIGSALANHGRRIGAQLATFIDSDGIIVGSSHAYDAADGSDGFPFRSMLVVGEKPATAVVEVDGDAYQLVVTSVRAPQHLGWVGIGFRIDDALANALKDLTRLEVSFYSPANGRAVLASTLAADRRPGLTAALREASVDSSPTEIDVLDTTYLSVGMPLGVGEGSVVTLLQRSLADALAGYRKLFRQLIAIFGVALLLSIPVARLVAANVTRPVTVLGQAAARIEQGQYNEVVADGRRDELGTLAKAFNSMQHGIAQREARIVHQSRHDELTGLPNRVAIRDAIDTALGSTDAADPEGMVVLLDIVGFKPINDIFGHDAGDAVLVRLATLFREIVGDSRQMARYGGNSFVIVLQSIEESSALELLGRIHRALEQPLEIAQAMVRVELTAGLSRFPQHGDSAEALLRRAEIAMYGARDRAVATAVYRTGEDESHLRRLELSNELSKAIDADGLEVYFQPKLDLTSGDCRFAEALVRWRHETLGAVSPAEFIPIAEQSGLMQPLTRMVLRKSIRQLGAWNAEGLRVKVSINLSAIDLLNEDLPDLLGDLITAAGVSADQLCLEITETAVMQHGQATSAMLMTLEGMGLELSIDDFGTGYSSLAQLKSMPVSELKIDQSFIAELPQRQDDTVIVKSVVELAHNMNLRVVAEGVETVECIRWLAASGCEMAQGYLLSRPLPAKEFAAWVREFDPRTVFDEPLRRADAGIDRIVSA